MQQKQTQLFYAESLPFSVMSLSQLGYVTLQGEEAKSYLQGQVTQDVMAIKENQTMLAAHCDAKGKLLGYMHLFSHEQNLAFIAPQAVLTEQVAALKKYAIFSKVQIEIDSEKTILGFAGKDARSHLSQYFPSLPDQHQNKLQLDNTTLLYLPWPTERFIVITDRETAIAINQHVNANMASAAQWQLLDIQAGYPILDNSTNAQFLPQALNLQALDAISFNKGCYVGQEMVARAKFRGANKRALFYLQGQANQLPAMGEGLEMQLGDNWRETGIVLAAIAMPEGEIMVQLVMNRDIEPQVKFRVKHDLKSQLTIQPLSYSLAED